MPYTLWHHYILYSTLEHSAAHICHYIMPTSCHCTIMLLHTHYYFVELHIVYYIACYCIAIILHHKKLKLGFVGSGQSSHQVRSHGTRSWHCLKKAKHSRCQTQYRKIIFDLSKPTNFSKIRTSLCRELATRRLVLMFDVDVRFFEFLVSRCLTSTRRERLPVVANERLSLFNV